FESDPQGTGWSTSGAAVVQGTNARTGNRALRLIGSGAGAQQTIAGLAPGTTYTLGGWAFVTDPAGGDQAQLGIKDYGGVAGAAQFATGTYAPGSVTFTTGPTSTTATVY